MDSIPPIGPLPFAWLPQLGTDELPGWFHLRLCLWFALVSSGITYLSGVLFSFTHSLRSQYLMTRMLFGDNVTSTAAKKILRSPLLKKIIEDN